MCVYSHQGRPCEAEGTEVHSCRLMMLPSLRGVLACRPKTVPRLRGVLVSADNSTNFESVQAEDETKLERGLRELDVGLLDAVTWPEYVWEWLRSMDSPLASLHDPAQVQPQAARPATETVFVAVEGVVLRVWFSGRGCQVSGPGPAG